MEWGPSYWRCIHYMAIHNEADIIQQIPLLLPCEQCKLDWVPPEIDENLVTWSINIHNSINAKLGKWDKWNLIDFNISQKSTCDICENKEYLYNFPWHFLYNVAKTNHDIAVDFIKEFSRTYPCEECRGKLITHESLLPDETHVDWVYRNHLYFNNVRGLPEPKPHVTDPNSSCCPGSSAQTLTNATNILGFL